VVFLGARCPLFEPFERADNLHLIRGVDDMYDHRSRVMPRPCAKTSVIYYIEGRVQEDFYYWRTGVHGVLRMIGKEGGAEKTIIPDTIVSFDISPDGNWLAVLKEADRESCDLWLVHADSKQQVFVPTTHHNMTDVVFSHTYSLVIFYAAGGSIYRTRPDENEDELVAELPNRWHRWFELTPEDSVMFVDYVPKPAVHPGGRYVAFPIVIDYYTECAFVIMDLENGTSDTLEAKTYLKSTAAFPEWWFDGTSLVFTGHRVMAGGCPNASMQEGEIWLLKNALPE
jgi:hypothetical protein